MSPHHYVVCRRQPFPSMSAARLSAILAADSWIESRAKWAYRAVVSTWLWPNSLPIMGVLKKPGIHDPLRRYCVIDDARSAGQHRDPLVHWLWLARTIAEPFEPDPNPPALG